MNDIITQMLGYGCVVFLMVFVISFFQRSFFWNYFRVKGSLGRLILIKVRDINIDGFTIGKIKEGMLSFKYNKEEKLVAINNNSVFYRCMGVIWVDYDSQTSGLVKPDFTTIDGFDVVKYTNLYLRALYKPAITDNLDKIMILLLIICIIASITSVYFSVKNGTALTNIVTQMASLQKGNVVGSGVI